MEMNIDDIVLNDSKEYSSGISTREKSDDNIVDNDDDNLGNDDNMDDEYKATTLINLIKV